MHTLKSEDLGHTGDKIVGGNYIINSITTARNSLTYEQTNDQHEADWYQQELLFHTLDFLK